MEADNPSRAIEAGLGKASGLGCPDGASHPLAGVYAMLQAGSPRLALARAWGVPFAPWLVNIEAVFPSADVTLSPVIGSDEKFVQDTIVDKLVIRVTNGNTATSTLSSMSDFFLNYQSGIKARLQVQGQPGYAVAPNLMPISTLADMIGGAGNWPGGWVLSYQQALQMQFQTPVPLPATPVTVTATFRCWIPIGERFVQMQNAYAVEKLGELGIDCGGLTTQACW